MKRPSKPLVLMGLIKSIDLKIEKYTKNRSLDSFQSLIGKILNIIKEAELYENAEVI
jgi:hypothetical protein